MGDGSGTIIPELQRGMVALGIRSGDCLIVHSSFKSLGLHDRTPADVIRTMIEAIGADGTLMMPTFSYSYSGPRDTVPFNPATTPGKGNGILTETLRQWPGALRSGHPTHSVAATGKHAAVITKDKENASALGIGSSYDEALKLGARILLLGVRNDRNSMLHSAESAARVPYGDIPFRAFWGRSALVEKDGKAVEVPLVPEFPGCSMNFNIVEPLLDEKGLIKRGRLCAADCMLMDANAMVGAVCECLRKEPEYLLCDNLACEPCNLRKQRLRERGLM